MANVDPVYWVAVCRGKDAVDAFCFPPPGRRLQDVMSAYWILMLPDFPDTIAGLGQIAGSSDPDTASLFAQRAEQLRRVQADVRAKHPREYAQMLVNCAIELANDPTTGEFAQENKTVSLARAVDCFAIARPLLDAHGDPKNLRLCLFWEANSRAMLAGMRQDSQRHLRDAIVLLEQAATLADDPAERARFLAMANENRTHLAAIERLEGTAAS